MFNYVVIFFLILLFVLYLNNTKISQSG